MKIKPKFRGFICTTAHPEGCARNVREQIQYVKSRELIDGPKNVLIIGASTGYGMASRIASTFGSGAKTVGVFFEKPASDKRPGTPGWYNTVEFEKQAHEAGYYCKSINGDAFSEEIKDKTIEIIKEDLGKVDLVIYSLAAPRRKHPVTGELFSSTLKPIGSTYESKTVDFHTNLISDVKIEPANPEEIRQTVTVMGGEDWKMWIDALTEADVLAEGATTVAYSYIGPKITYPVYREGTIGKAKEHLEETAHVLNKQLKNINGRAFVSVNKALVTQASSAIPVVPLYISLLYKIMKEKDIHEGCIEQTYRLFSDFLYEENVKVDDKGRIRIDDWEMREDVQKEVMNLWDKINTENVEELTDIEGYRKEFYKLFGFGYHDLDYEKDVEHNIDIPSIK